MTAYRLYDDAHALHLPQPVESDRAAGCGVLRGALLGSLLWITLLALYLAI